MKIYRLTVRPRSPLRTPFQADTLFGHFCWAIAEKEGEAVLGEFLAGYDRGSPAVIFSNGFPTGYLPRPLLPPLTRPERDVMLQQWMGNQQNGESRIIALDRMKKVSKWNWVRREVFFSLSGKLSEKNLMEALNQSGDQERQEHSPSNLKPVKFDRLQNTINRISNHTEEGGGLYSTEAWVYDEVRDVDIYLGVEPEGCLLAEADLKALLEQLFDRGYGADASTGCGHCEIKGFEADPEITSAEGGWAMALSNFLPDVSIPIQDAFYKVMPKFGKLGGGVDVNPFKKPLLMMMAGATFPVKERRPYYGVWLKDMHATRPEIRHHAYTLAVHFNRLEEVQS